ncbi:phosphatase 2C-domain-containing protein [Mycena sp. CBHHK59/15]|nr:phosphatase 2C-domain-containing protein [Mycena sp. CBHHK59/15]
MIEPFSNSHTESGENERLHYACCRMQAWKSKMEDTSVALLELDAALGSKSNAFFGVYDGHFGSKTAEFCRDNLHVYLKRSTAYELGKYPEALRSAFMEGDRAWRDLSGECEEGSTAATALVTAERIFVANAGDSRAIMSVNGRAKTLSVDHDCALHAEAERVRAAGGKVIELGGTKRIDLEGPNGTTDFIRAARGFGDFPFKMRADLKPEAQVVTARPDILSHARTAGDEFLILASDGIWECLRPQQLVDFVRHQIGRGHDLASITQVVTRHCLSPTYRSLLGQDNTTIMIVALREQNQNAAQWMRLVGDRITDVAAESAGELPAINWSSWPGPQDIDGITFIVLEDEVKTDNMPFKLNPHASEFIPGKAVCGVGDETENRDPVQIQDIRGEDSGWATSQGELRHQGSVSAKVEHGEQGKNGTWVPVQELADGNEEFVSSATKGWKRTRRTQGGKETAKRAKEE